MSLHPRRHYLLLALDARIRFDDGLWFTLRGQQQEIAGTALATTFPGYANLIAAGYTCNEDIRGADSAELMNVANLSHREADAVIAAIGS